MMESAAERQALASFSGEYATVGSETLQIHFAEPQAEDVLVEGVAPALLAERVALETLGLTRGSRIDSVHALDGRITGPFRIVFWRSVDDGAFVELGLEVTT